jgi:SAM-dependent methyltransferase
MEHDLAELEEELFRTSWLLKVRRRAIASWIGTLRDDARCLCVGAIPRALQEPLISLGGQWDFVASGDDPIPGGEGVYDQVLILDELEWIADDYGFIESCHKRLKPAGVLLVDTAHDKRWTLWRPLRRLLGVEERPASRARDGYSEAGLFDLLKDGYDVQRVRTYSRCVTEGVETMVRLAIGAFLGRADADDPEERLRAHRGLCLVQTIAYPFFAVANILDHAFFFTRGYRIMALARRRLWKPRRAPILRDGRTLADATLNTKIGTATQFH